ncbi:MAG TPA: hypothetical protein VGM37_04220 [Armatimonadota bacterium]|jgi:hypothetical protein
MTERLKDSKLEITGAWEEIAARASEFAGRRVTLTVEPVEAVNAAPRPSLAETLEPLLRKAETLQRGEPVPHADPYEIAFGEILEEKKRQGRL